ncbi:unannotated protein [freshwater metagenome]|uniref:Unannotated protein n=1 Tax=freshwater metagenome TaxID=449393 RepID=A0A6J7F8M9_9ZZZZ|nr:hypothetical protein [Actinomycetota bacterium]
MSDPVDALWGSGELDAVFRHGAAKVGCPFPRAGGIKNAPSVLQQFTNEMLQSPIWLTEVDPRQLWSSQGWVLREHADYYRSGSWEITGVTSADCDRESNRYPLVLVDHRDRMVIAAGHHRSLVALIEGRPLLARVFPAAPDGAVALLPHLLFGTATRLDHVLCTSAADAEEQALAGRTVLCPARDVAVVACLALAPGFDRWRLPIGDDVDTV